MKLLFNAATIKQFLTDRKKQNTYLLLLLSFISLFVCLLTFFFNHGVILYIHVIALAAADSLLIALPYLFLPVKWKKTILIPVWAIALYCLCSSMYFQFFHEAFPFSALLWWSNLDSNVTSNIAGTLQISDVIFIVFPVIVTIVCLKLKPLASFSKKIQILATTFTLLIYVLVQSHFVYLVYNLDKNAQKNYASSLSSWLNRAYLKPNWSAIDDISSIGLLTYTIKTASNAIGVKFRNGKLKDEDAANIKRFLDAKNNSQPILANSGKNVILIIVESLNSWVIGKKYGTDNVSFTPVLDSIIAGDNCISALKVKSQICLGQSSDGQLIYNTGLLPLRNDVVAYNYAENKFVGLPAVLKRNGNSEVIYESSRAWNHHITSKSFGYEQLFAQSDLQEFAKEKGWNGKDGMLFDFAVKEIKQFSQPFFCEITTLSMHAPYTDCFAKYDERIDALQDLNDEHRNYLKMVSYFDRELGRFINNLKSLNLFDNTILIIASDHHTNIEDKGIPNDKNIAFIGYNAGISRNIDNVVGQIDIYPTILDLAGITETSYNWRGLGCSMLGDVLKSAVTHDGVVHGEITSDKVNNQKEAWDISELILRTNYFKYQK